jgi:hypothetical protein
MAKVQPPDTTGHQLYLPNELDRKLKLLAKYGTVDDFIIKCLEAGLAPHWKEYVAQEYARLHDGEQDESKQTEVRRGSRQADKSGAAKTLGNKTRQETQT